MRRVIQMMVLPMGDRVLVGFDPPSMAGSTVMLAPGESLELAYPVMNSKVARKVVIEVKHIRNDQPIIKQIGRIGAWELENPGEPIIDPKLIEQIVEGAGNEEGS